MKKFLKISLFVVATLLVSFVLVSMFWLADLRTSEIKNDKQSEEKIALAKTLLEQVVIKQGLDKIHQFSTYEVIGTDHWQGMMGDMGNPWAWNGDLMAMRFTVGDFDGQAEVLQGEHTGYVAGMQSWDYYEKIGDSYKNDMEHNGGQMFALAAFHYFFEFGNRLSNAPFIRYAYEDEFNGKEMDVVYVSWGNDCTKEHDQYLVWIGKESGLIEATAFTTRDNPMPAPAFIYGAMRFDDYRDVDGILVPFTQTAQLGDPKEDIGDYIHQLNIQSFSWDSFHESDIRPLSGLDPIGDEKPE